MVMTKEQRVELLKLAREAKAKKKQERDAEKPKAVMGRPKKQKEPVEDTFEPPVEEPMEVDEPKMKVDDDEIDNILDKGKYEPKRRLRDRGRSLELRLKEKEEPKRPPKVQMKEDDDEEVQEEIIYKKKPKKKILRKIIYEESTDDEVEEVVIDNRKKKPIEKPAKVKEVTKPVPLNAQPKEPEVKSFNFFRY